MSFRTRLSLFFVLIVVVPMVSLTFVLFRLIADSEDGKADAGLGARQQTAISVVDEAQARAGRGALAVGQDMRFATALQRGQLQAAGRRAEELLRSLELKRIVVTSSTGATTVDVGSRSAIFPARRSLQDAGGRSFGLLQVSAQGPLAYTREVKRVTGLDVVVRRDDQVLATSDPAAARMAAPREPADVELDGREFRAASFLAPAFTGRTLRVSLFGQRASSGDVGRSRRVAAGILLGFLVLAFGFAVLVSRSLQQQIQEFLDAARRLGRGDFSSRVPTTGQDEFAELGEEFNRMSGELEQRLADLSAERERLAGALRRIGDTFASNLDSRAVLEIVVATALDGTGALGARAGTRATPEAPLEKVAEVGSFAGLEAALWTAEAAAAKGEQAEAAHGSAYALAHPLRTLEGAGVVMGVVSVVRADRPFGEGERDLFAYLARQAAVSLENVGLHETVERQAVTDELTGLANRRQFQDTLTRETERARRFDVPIGLVMIDIDNFKSVNDTYGHQTGDVVLREVGRIVRESSREIDTPARYGGEELAMVLPETDVAGAFQLAERVRRGIEQLVVETPEGGELRVTASFGVATQPGPGADARELVEAADAALYEAKASGKNRTVRATRVGLR